MRMLKIRVVIGVLRFSPIREANAVNALIEGSSPVRVQLDGIRKPMRAILRGEEK